MTGRKENRLFQSVKLCNQQYRREESIALPSKEQDEVINGNKGVSFFQSSCGKEHSASGQISEFRAASLP